MSTKWVVNALGAIGECRFEISVLRDDNTQGKAEFGRFGENKLLITQNGEQCPNMITAALWQRSVSIAQEVANELNRIGGL